MSYTRCRDAVLDKSSELPRSLVEYCPHLRSGPDLQRKDRKARKQPKYNILSVREAGCF